MKMFFGEKYKVTDNFIISQPTIGDILNVGEEDFYSMVNIFVGNATMYRVPLWKAGIDWNKISDFELFISLTRGFEVTDASRLLFGDINFDLFQPLVLNSESGEKEIVLYNPEQQILIKEETYLKMREYLRYMLNIHPKVEKAKGKTTKEWIIQEEIEKIEKNKGIDKSFLLPLISSCINHPGFKYKLDELRDVGIVQFMDSVKRIQIYESTVALLSGSYSGFMDTSKVDKNNFDFMRDVS
jgi:hypothetical protein